MSSKLSLIHLNQFGAVVYELRGTDSQGRYAKRIGYESGGNVAVSRIESGKLRPGADVLVKICHEAHISPTQLFERAAQVELTDGCALVHNQRCLTPAIQTEVLNLYKKLPKAEFARIEDWEKHLIERQGILDQTSALKNQTVVAAFDQAHSKFIAPLLIVLSKRSEFETFSSEQDWQVVGLGDADIADRVFRADIAGSLTHIAAKTGAAGVASGAFAAALYASVGAFGTASTGAAIGGLSGAAASSATLAWLGGGSLAAGGLGVVGGTVLLSSVIGIPVLAVLSIATWRQFESKRKKEEAHREQLRQLDADLTKLEKELSQVWEWATRVADLMNRAAKVGQTLLDRGAGRLSVVADDGLGIQMIEEAKQSAIDIMMLQMLAIWPLKNEEGRTLNFTKHRERILHTLNTVEALILARETKFAEAFQF